MPWKIAYFAIVGLMVVGLTGCGSDWAAPPEDNDGYGERRVPQRGTYRMVRGPTSRYDHDKPFANNKEIPPENAPVDTAYGGTVRSVDATGNSITVSVNGQDMTFAVAPDAFIYSGDNPRSFRIPQGLAKVRAGNRVDVSVRQDGNVITVTSMKVTTRAEGF